MQIAFTISATKIQRVTDAMKGRYPIPVDENGDPQYTDGQWAKEKLRRWLVDLVYRHEVMVAKQNAQTLVLRDDSLIS